MSKGTKMLILLLVVITLVVITLISLIAYFSFNTGFEGGLFHIIWDSFMRTLDPGNLCNDYETHNTGYIVIMILSTLYGIFMTSALIGIIAESLRSKIDQLQRGNSPILEKGHTLLLGFDEHAYTIINELVEANRNVRKSSVVVLAQIDRLQMEEAIRKRLPGTGRTQVICRQGMVDNFTDLRNAGILSCKSILILPQNHDARTIKTLLACNILLRDNKAQTFITASIFSQSNLPAAYSAGGSYCEVLYFERTMARILAQVTYQPGMSAVFSELFSFHGMELYIERIANCGGMKYGDFALSLENACLIGVSRGGVPDINPLPDYVLQDNDAFIVLAEDDHVAAVSHKPVPVDESAFAPMICNIRSQKGHILILGINHLLYDTIDEISAYLAPGSSITIASSCLPKLNHINSEINIKPVQCNILDRGTLANLLHTPYDAIISLSDMSKEPEQSDADSLIIMLHLNDLLKSINPRPAVVSEIRDPINRDLAECTNVNDLVIGSSLISLLMTQISERREMSAILDCLLSEAGSEIHIKSARRYIHPHQKTNVRTLTASVLRYHESFIGYKETMKGSGNGIVFNPSKDKDVLLDEDDFVIVLARDIT